MNRPVTFDFSLPKFVAAMTHLAKNVPDLTKLRASKLFFFADKYHLVKYGRPILGDQYARMPNGPVPSQSYNLMNELICPEGFTNIPGIEVKALQKFLEVRKVRGHWVFKAKKDPDLTLLSESDMEALDFAIRAYGKKSISALWKAGHKERAWKESESHWIDYRLFFDPNDQEQKAVLEMLEEEREDAGLLEELARS